MEMNHAEVIHVVVKKAEAISENVKHTKAWALAPKLCCTQNYYQCIRLIDSNQSQLGKRLTQEVAFL